MTTAQSFDANGSPVEQDGDVTLYQTPAVTVPNVYGTMHVDVTDDLIAALDYVTDVVTPERVYTEMLCLKVQALVLRERARKVAV